MTIIEPNKGKKHWKKYLVPLFAVVVGGAAANIYLYSDIINLRDRMARQEEELQKIEVGNAELKNKLYTILDPNRLKAMALEAGFVMENRPNYLETMKAL